MTTIKVASLIFDDLTYEVPSTVEEYNALDPKRPNAVVEDAVDNIMKHRVLGGFRSDFLDAVEKKYSIERKNFGTEKEPRWESDAKFMNRVIAEVLTTRGKNPSDAGAVAELRNELRDEAQKCLTAQKFVVAAREATGGQPALAKTYIAWAEQAIAQDGGTKLAGLLESVLQKTDPTATVTLTGNTADDTNTLARAIAANEKRKRDAQLAAAKAEYGIEAAA